jgi:hypothetical protein
MVNTGEEQSGCVIKLRPGELLGKTPEHNVLHLAHAVIRSVMKGSEILSDEALKEIIESEEELNDLFLRLYRDAMPQCRTEIRYRQRRQELDTLPTEELQRQYDQIGRARQQAIALDVYDEDDDWLYASPPKDSAEHIIYELLGERKKDTV